MQDHFKSVFSEPNDDLLLNLKCPSPEITQPLPDLNLTCQDFIEAINEMKAESSCPHSCIPAKVFKCCKLSLCKPLKIFWEKSFLLGTVPKSYKLQQIIPLHKKGPKSNSKNFRPISLTSHVVKIFERVLRKKLVTFLELNNIINKNQHGFRKNHSCLTQLVHHVDIILNHLINNSDVDSIYVDFAKAFDKVDHKILIEKLKLYKLTDPYINWISDFLIDRHQYVFLNNVRSYEAEVKSGVPQGSVLGPLFFILYINDLSQNIFNSHILTFADDTKLTHPINTINDTFSLQKDLDNVINWSKNNNMALNKDKFELICYKHKNKNNNLRVLEELPFHSSFKHYETSSNTFISESLCVKDLGVFINSNLDWSDHILNLSKMGKRLSFWILNVFYNRSKEVMLTLFNSLVRSRLEYCCQIWNPFQIQHIDAIENVQRVFTRKIQYMNNYSYWERLKKLNIMSLQRRREKMIIIFVWMLKNNKVTNNINLQFSQDRKGNIKAQIKPLPKIRGRILTIYENSFSITSVKLWNKLPPKICEINNLSLFKIKLHDYLTLYPDNPPVKGYYHTNKNSLLDYKSI